MRRLGGFFLILLFTISVSSGKLPLYLVIDAHPEHEAILNKYTETFFTKGRVHLVRLKEGVERLPESLAGVLRPVSQGEVRVYVPEAKKTTAADPRVSELLSRASLATFRQVMDRLVGFENRGTRDLARKADAGNRGAQLWLSEKLKEFGYAAELHCYKTHGFAQECNVLAEKTGLSSGVVLVLAHMDDVGHANAGADDNASGSAALLTMAEAAAGASFGKTVRFLITNGEEGGYNGSEAYVAKLKSQGRLSELSFVINMDMVGYNSNGLFEIETNQPFETQARWLAELARTYTRLTPEITIPAWGSDHVPFLNENIPTVLTIEDWQTKTPCYHRACDKRETINENYAMEIIRLNLAAVSELAGLSGR